MTHRCRWITARRRCSAAQVLWRDIRMGDMVSLPRLVDVQWSVSTTVAAGGTSASTSSPAGSAVGVPTAVLSLTVEGEQRHVDACPPRQRCVFALAPPWRCCVRVHEAPLHIAYANL